MNYKVMGAYPPSDYEVNYEADTSYHIQIEKEKGEPVSGFPFFFRSLSCFFLRPSLC